MNHPGLDPGSFIFTGIERARWIPGQARNDSLVFLERLVRFSRMTRLLVVLQFDIATEALNSYFSTTTTLNMFQMTSRPMFRMVN